MHLTGKVGKRGIPCWAAAFLVNLAVALAAVGPYLISDHGYMAMSHDFSAQEIAFNMLMNDTVKSGNLLWNWGIDLGSNFLETFSFYNVGSPFFWLTLLFPARYLSRVMGWMIILKFAVAGATSAAYLERHVQKRTAVIIASLLYAFSSYQCGSVVFYHFQDVVALFPLLLIGLELLIEEKKKGRLLLACVGNLLCNYIFFVGEVLFLVLYYVFRYLVPQLRGGKKKIREILSPIGACMLEGAIGMLATGVLLLPSLRGTLANSRIAVHLQGNAWLTRTTAEWLQMLKAVLLPAEPMNYQSSISGADWMSNMAYLPMVGLLLVLAYAFARRDWISGLLKASVLIAAVPILNSAFMSFNETPYRRWYYMTILIMALASAKVIEAPEKYPIKKAAWVLLALYGFFWAMLRVVKWDDQETAMVFYERWFYMGLGMGVGCVLLTLAILKWGKRLQCYLLLGTVAFCSSLTLASAIKGYRATTDNTGQDFKGYTNTYGENVYHYLTDIPRQLDRDVLPYRYYFDEDVGYTYYNLSMANSLPSINSFISTVHASVKDFYDGLGIGRMTWTNADNTGTRELLSARHIVSLRERPEYTLVGEVDNSNGQTMYLYENENALPIGFTYDTYLLESEFEKLDKEVRPTAMLGYLVVKDEDEEKVEGILKHLPWADITVMSVEQRPGFLEERRRECSSAFRSEDNAFESHIIADSGKYAFFSVPYDQCWEASVNGEKREILNINGLMAVRIDAGENQIRFDYVYKPLLAGLVCTGVGIAAWGLYLGLWYGRKRKVVK